MSWLITGTQKIDPDAAVYLSRVEAADGQVLEAGVRTAVDQFVIGCKADGIWPAIKASCILSGARTLSGALVPLVGPTPTNFNFVAGDYNRETGLVGNGSTKYLNTNHPGDINLQNNRHAAINITSATNITQAFLSSRRPNGDDNGAIQLLGDVGGLGMRMSASSGFFVSVPVAAGFFGGNRTGSTQVNVRYNNGLTGTDATASQTPTTDNFTIFARQPIPNAASTSRISFYSIGESLNLALLDARVTTLMNALAAAIP